MASFNIYDGGTWRKAKNVWVYDGGTWRKAKGAWTYDGGTWRKGFTSEKSASIRISFNMAVYHHEDGYTTTGNAKQGFYGASNKERTGWWYHPNGQSDIRGCMPSDFSSLVSVTATLSVNRSTSGDYGSTRNMRVKMTTKTGYGSPDAVNGYWDCPLSGGSGWKYNISSGAYNVVLSQCISRENGARNIILNADDGSWGSGGWSYNYLGTLGAYTDVNIVYRPT